MRIYDLSCDRCLWKAPMPVSAEVAEKFRGRHCVECKVKYGVLHLFTVKERIVVGPVQYLPLKGGEK